MITEKPITNWAADEEQENFYRRLHAYNDATKKSLKAKDKFSKEFNDPTHLNNIMLALAALHKRFGQADIYENSRENRGKPFTVLKVRNPHYHSDDIKRKQVFLAELDKIPTKVEAIPNVRSGDYIVRIYC